MLSEISKISNIKIQELGTNYISLISKLETLSEKINRISIFKKLKSMPKGFYIYGSTGSGKTTLMNIFFQSLKTEKKINMHFHDYFLDISRLLTKYTMKELIKILSTKLEIICFDEFYIESIADARLLQDLFEGLLKMGVIIVITSNFVPEKLYESGFNRHLIFPDFSNFLSEYLQVFNLSHTVDFREQNHLNGSIVVQNIPEIQNSASTVLLFNGNKLHCTCNEKEAIFEYNELFKKPRSVNEFIFTVRKFDKIYIKNFAIFRGEVEDEIIRFRNFIDVAYLRNTIVFLEGNFLQEDIFETKLLENIKIKRTYSRIIEMSSVKFLMTVNSNKRKWHNEARIFFEKLLS